MFMFYNLEQHPLSSKTLHVAYVHARRPPIASECTSVPKIAILGLDPDLKSQNIKHESFRSTRYLSESS